MAEKEGFEPSIPFWGIHDFQSCALGQLRDFSMSAFLLSPDIIQQKMKFVNPYFPHFPKVSHTLFSDYLGCRHSFFTIRQRALLYCKCNHQKRWELLMPRQSLRIWRQQNCDRPFPENEEATVPNGSRRLVVILPFRPCFPGTGSSSRGCNTAVHSQKRRSA